MIKGDNENTTVLLGITLFIDYIAIYLIYCIVVFCLYTEMALYNIIYSKTMGECLKHLQLMFLKL